MEGSTQDQQQRLKKSKRFGILAAVSFFLSALFSSVGFPFLLIFGLSGIYCAFLWLYFSHQATPKRKSFDYGNADRLSWRSTSPGSNAIPSGRLGFLIVIGGMIFVLLIAVFVFTNDSATEETPEQELQISDSNQSETEHNFAILKNDPNNLDALTNVGNSFFANESYDSALYYYDRVLRIDPNNSPALYNKSLVRFNQKDFSGAAELALRCVKIDPSNTDAFMLLGDCYEEQNNLDLALTQYNKAYELGARTPGLSNMLAYIYDTKGNTTKAVLFYKETLEQDSTRVDAYTRLAELEPGKKTWYEKEGARMESKIAQVRKEKFGRYFIAIIPPQPTYEEVHQLKKHFSERYNSNAALCSPPHITLHMPFEWRREKEMILCDKLNGFFDKMNDLEVELLNFSCFAPRTIFIDVVKSPQLENFEKELQRFCRKELNLFNARYQDLPFHPHVTVAFRDLRKATFANAWNECKDKKFTAKFSVSKVALLKHNGKLWEPHRYFSLN